MLAFGELTDPALFEAKPQPGGPPPPGPDVDAGPALADGGGDAGALSETFFHFSDDPHEALDQAKRKAAALVDDLSGEEETSVDDLRAQLSDALGRELGELGQARSDAAEKLETKLESEMATLRQAGASAADEVSERAGALSAQSGAGVADSLRESQSAQLDRLSAGQDAAKGRVDDGAKADRERIAKAGDTAKAENDDLGHGQADGLRSAARENAEKAKDAGTRGAAEARASAAARAQAAPVGERLQIFADGEARAKDALRIGNARAEEIRQDGEAKARAVDEKVAERNQRLATLGGTEKLDDRAGKAAGDLSAAAERASGKLGLDGALDAIAAEKAKVAKAGSKETSGVAKKLEQEEARLREEHARALAELDKEHERRVAAAKAKAKDAERKLAKGGRDLSRMVAGAIKSIDAQSVKAEAEHAETVQQGETELGLLGKRQAKRIGKHAREALAALEAVAARAERKIAAEARAEKRRLKRAGDAGARELAQIADATVAANRKSADASERALSKQGAKDRKAFLDESAGVMLDWMDLDAAGDGVAGEIEKELVDDAVRTAQAALVPGPGGVTDAAAVSALDTLLGLPEDEQAKAVAALDFTSWQTFLDEVPPARRLELDGLFQSTQDPARKLQLWQTVAHQRSTDDLSTATRAAGADTERLARLGEIGDENRAEIDDEAAFLADKLAKGQKVTAKDVADLSARKKHELEVELRFGINFKNERNLGDPDTAPEPRTNWTIDELDQVASGLSHLPAEHLREVHTINRAKTDYDWNDVKEQYEVNNWTGANAGGHEINVFDASVNKDYRNTGQSSQLAGITGLTSLAETIVHETGHLIDEKLEDDDRDDDPVDRFGDAAGWASYETKVEVIEAMKKAGMNDRQIRRQLREIDQTRDKNFYERHSHEAGDVRFSADAYGDGYVASDVNAVPNPYWQSDRDPWEYARSDEGEHFAEAYMMAALVPEDFYRVMIERPTSALEANHKAREKAEEALNASTTPKARKAAEARLAEIDANIVEIEETIQQRGDQFEIMRKDVYHAPEAVQTASAALAGTAVKAGNEQARADRIATFEKDAAHALTPEHVETLRAAAAADLSRL